MEKSVKIEQHSGLGVAWFIGWLFSVGFLKMGFFKGVVALFIWPYFLGVHFEEAADAPAPAAQERPQAD
jgi:hypothetical protein